MADGPQNLNEPPSATAVVDHLTAPRKKRKSYVVLAFGKGMDAELASSIEKFIRSNFASMSLAFPRNRKDIIKMANRQIVMIAVDDHFAAMEDTIETVRAVKTKKGTTAVPVVFFTNEADKLIHLYNEKLLPFQEVDEYILYKSLPPNQVMSRINKLLKEKNPRRSRRFQTEIDMSFFHLTKDKTLNGHIKDMSLHGALIQADKDVIFKSGDQIRINLPVAKYIDHHEGEFMKVSARVRRVFLGGNEAAISWEYLSDHQTLKLTEFITGLVNKELLKRSGNSPTTIQMLSRKEGK